MPSMSSCFVLENSNYKENRSGNAISTESCDYKPEHNNNNTNDSLFLCNDIFLFRSSPG